MDSRCSGDLQDSRSKAAVPQKEKMTGYEEMKGAYAALFTPYTKDNRINTEMVGRIVEHQLAGGLRGFFVGGIGTTYNLLPGHFAEICRLMNDANDAASARPLQAEANAVIALMLKYGNMSYAKAMMRFIGLDCGQCRGPFPPLSEKQCARLAEELREQGVLKENGL